MKITHICLCGPVTDNWSYQDNLLPKYHKKLGYEVSVITSKYVWGKKGKLDLDSRYIYFNEYNIKTIRIKSKYNTTINSKLKKYKDLLNIIEQESPDILFVHGVQFLDIKKIVKYVKNHSEVKVYVDNHSDFSNSASNWLSKNIMHKIIWRKCAQLISPYTTKFYGVLPARVDFLENMYKLPKNKLDLLLMGADDEKIAEAKNETIQQELRKRHDIKKDDFLIITGGKIDNAKKQTIFLMKAVKKLANPKVKLIVFGSVIKELKEEINKLSNSENIKYIGWVDSEDTYKYFGMADLVIFPGRHSVFWEQVAGLGIPMIVKYWEGTTHIGNGDNCIFLYKDNVDEIKDQIEFILYDKKRYKKMKIAAEQNKVHFLYSEIARKSIR